MIKTILNIYVVDVSMGIRKIYEQFLSAAIQIPRQSNNKTNIIQKCLMENNISQTNHSIRLILDCSSHMRISIHLLRKLEKK